VTSGRLTLIRRRSWSEVDGKFRSDFDPKYCFQIPSISGVLLLEPTRVPSPVFSLTSSIFMCFIFFFFYSSVFFSTYIYRMDLILCIQQKNIIIIQNDFSLRFCRIKRKLNWHYVMVLKRTGYIDETV
jgi:hypothetical protein